VTDRLDEIQGLQGLTDPVRRSLYRHVVADGEPVGRDAAARAVGISRSLAAYHLDRLVEDGLLEARYERLTARRGPGAGRPSKLYLRSRARFQVSVPPRDYELPARVLAEAVESDMGGPAAVARIARGLGRQIGAEASRATGDAASSAAADRLTRALEARGYEPYDDDGTIRLRNCPFDALASDHRNLVCGMNLALIEGATEALGDDALHPRLDPRSGECCVSFNRRGPDS
jgi:predicted ArsR family transcriptional regulator